MATRNDVHITFRRMAQAASEAGLNVEGWRLQPGSKVNGISWSILAGLAGSSDLTGLPPFGHIGKTAREAELFLSGMAAAFESIAYARRRTEQ